MISCLVLASHVSVATALTADLESAGIHVIGAVERGKLVQEVVRLAPDIVVAQETAPDEALFTAFSLMLATRPTPLLLFTSDPDADKLARALDAGVDTCVVDGYARSRLRPLIHLTQLRFERERKLQAALADVSNRFEERKLVDRAKGILMRARQVSEDEAFRVLRVASMHSNQRVGQVSQHVISSAVFAEAVNRGGQLRMLSQRVIKLYALCLADAAHRPHAERLASSVQRVDANLASLAKNLSRSTYGDLIDAVLAPWKPLKAALAATIDASRLAEIDRLAEQVLLHADRLVNNLDSAGLAVSLHVINVSGRQRMLSQRIAKQALLGVLAADAVASAALADVPRIRDEFERVLAHLNAAPLTTREIRESLDAAGIAWHDMVDALPRAGTPAGQRALGETSEALLALFEQLTDTYERSMQVLMG